MNLQPVFWKKYKTYYLMNKPLLLTAVISCSFILFSMTGWATDSDFLERIDTVMLQHETLHGDFKQKKFLSGFSLPISSSGEFKLVKSKMLVWDTQSPIKSTIELNLVKNEFLLDNHKINENAAATAIFQLMSEVIVAVFESDWNRLQNWFDITGDFIDQNTWQVKLVPEFESLSKIINQIELDGDSYLRHVTIIDTTQDKTQIEFLNISPQDSNAQ